MQTITPKEIPGFGPVGRTTGRLEDLAGMEFTTYCPPDVQPRTRIMAVCGVTDYLNDASPSSSGFFMSDFYLFYHILAPSRKFIPCLQ
jgi:hypothetical protein